MAFSNDMVLVARNLINKFGDDIKIIQIAQGVYDPSTGESPKTETITKAKGFPEAYNTNQLITDVINMDDVQMIIETSIELTKQDVIEYRNNRWEIRNIDEVRTQNKTIIYTLQIRK